MAPTSIRWIYDIWIYDVWIYDIWLNDIWIYDRYPIISWQVLAAKNMQSLQYVLESQNYSKWFLLEIICQKVHRIFVNHSLTQFFTLFLIEIETTDSAAVGIPPEWLHGCINAREKEGEGGDPEVAKTLKRS